MKPQTNATAPMLPIGYMAKQIVARPEWLLAEGVEEILSLSGCFSKDFADWIDFWKHNDHWLFDSPAIIQELGHEHGIDLTNCRWFYYECHDSLYNEEARVWQAYNPETTFGTSVQAPVNAILRGYDVVSRSCGSTAECSPLSCNHMAGKIPVNRHCLLDSLEEAIQRIDLEEFVSCEPGPYQIIAVFEVPQPPPHLQ